MQKPIEKIIARPEKVNMVGDGFRVYSYIPGPQNSRRRLSPFLVLDFNPAYDFGPSKTIRGVGAHPHKGFETVTIAYKGSVAHSDSAGNKGIIQPGEVQWMTAGSGILHKEYHEENFSREGGLFEMVQLWVNLPSAHKSVAPHYQALTNKDIPVKKLDDGAGIARVIAGSYEGLQGPATTYSPINLFDLKLQANKRIAFSLPEAYTTAILMIEGKARINDQKVHEHDFVLFQNKGSEVVIDTEVASVCLVLNGAPIDEPIAAYGPFVMNTQEEILQAISDMQLGKFGSL